MFFLFFFLVNDHGLKVMVWMQAKQPNKYIFLFLKDALTRLLRTLIQRPGVMMEAAIISSKVVPSLVHKREHPTPLPPHGFTVVFLE